MSIKKRPALGELLIRKGMITQTQLQQALIEQKTTKELSSVA